MVRAPFAETTMSDQKTERQDFHWFTSSVLHWRTDASLTRCLNRQRRADTDKSSMYRAKACCVYRVPLPADADYKIRDYRPVVDGVEFITQEVYDAK